MPTSTSKKTSKKTFKNRFFPPSWPPKTSRNPSINRSIYLSKRLHLDQQQKEIIEGACKLNKYLENITANHLYKNWSPSKWTENMEELNFHESSFILEICRNNPLKEYLKSWLFNWKHIESPIKGDDLIANGWAAGPAIGIEIKKQRMTMKISTKSAKRKRRSKFI